MDVVIFGNGAHGQDIAADLIAQDHTVVMADHDRIRRGLDGWTFGTPMIAGLNDSVKRRILVAALDYEHWNLGARLVWRDEGRWVHRQANIGPHIRLGAHTHINAGAFLTRCRLGDFVTVGPNATICGDVTIGDDVMIGAGAVIRNLLTIGDGAVIGCGAVVVEDVPPGVTVVGNPARPLVKTC